MVPLTEKELTKWGKTVRNVVLGSLGTVAAGATVVGGVYATKWGLDMHDKHKADQLEAKCRKNWKHPECPMNYAPYDPIKWKMTSYGLVRAPRNSDAKGQVSAQGLRSRGRAVLSSPEHRRKQ